MIARVAALLAVVLSASISLLPAPACCPAPPSGKPVVNADQTVVIIWDAARKMQHFIRRASFHSEADDFGFLVPTPSQPELAESGNDAFPYLFKLTEPAKKQMPRPPRGIGCKRSETPMSGEARVKVLDEKEVAGFKAVVLEATAADALVEWLKENGYAFSPEIEKWAEPYIKASWKITALKIAKAANEQHRKSVAAAALRLSFHTDRPLFPYREPDLTNFSQALGASNRLLRIYFIANARYQGLQGADTWTGKVVWANTLSTEARKKILGLLNLPEPTSPGQWWLTEFEDDWAYKAAAADLFFVRDATQSIVEREPIIEYVNSPWSFLLGCDGILCCSGVAVFVTLAILGRRANRHVAPDTTSK